MRPGSPPLNFQELVPLKAGDLRFPAAGPSALKKKGILGKAGNYFSAKANPKFTLLVKTNMEVPADKGMRKMYKEVKTMLIWDEEMKSELETFLREHPIGLCRHTRDEFKKGKKNRKLKNSHRGVCRRTECSALLVEDLLLTYLLQPLPPNAKKLRYKRFFDKFPVEKHITIYDPDLTHLKEGKLLVGGIGKKTMRHLGNSNGKQLWVFSLMLNTNSQLEELKNLARPLTLHGMRNSVRRSFILTYIASESKDTLTEWWTAIQANISGKTRMDFDNALNVATKIPNLEDKSLVKKLVPKTDEKDNVEVYGDKRYIYDFGTKPEIVHSTFKSPFNVEQLFSILTNTETAEEANQNFDSCLFGAANGNVNNVQKFNVLSTPTRAWGKTDANIGASQQKVLVQAVTKDSTGTSWFPAASEGSVLSRFSKFFSKFMTPKDKSFTRFFNLEKSHFVNYNKAKEVDGFTVVWNAAQESGLLESMSNDGASTADIGKVILKVKGLKSKTVEMDKLQHDLLCNNDTAKRDLHKHFSQKETTVENMIWTSGIGKLEEMAAIEYTTGTTDGARLAALRFVKFLTTEKGKQSLGDSLDSNVPLAAISLLGNIPGETSNYVVLKGTLRLLFMYMYPRKFNNRTRTLEHSKVVAAASVQLLRLISSIVHFSGNKELPCVLFSYVLYNMKHILGQHKEVVHTAYFTVVEKLNKHLQVLKKRALNTPVNSGTLTQVTYDIAELNKVCFELKSRMNHLKKNEKIEVLEKLIKKIKKEFKEELKTEIEKIGVPYLCTDRIKNKDVLEDYEETLAKYSLSSGAEATQLRAEVEASAYNMLQRDENVTETWKILFYRIDKDGFIDIDTGDVIPFDTVKMQQNRSLVSNEGFDCIESLYKPNDSHGVVAYNKKDEIVAAISQQTNDMGSNTKSNKSVIEFIANLGASLLELPIDQENCEVQLYVENCAKDLFGSSVLEANPELGLTWGKTIAANVGERLRKSQPPSMISPDLSYKPEICF